MRSILNLFILITGVSGLIYQVSWQKYLARLLGSDSIATAIILGTFLGGLSLGYYVCGRLTLMVKNQFRMYAVLEGLIGLWGLGFPLIFHITEKVTCSWTFSYPVSIIVQGLICSVILIAIPTICMGGTIPVLTRGLSIDLNASTRTHAGIYAVNTAGAFIGTLLAGFFLVPKIGLPGSVWTAATLNLAAAAFFYTYSQYAPASDTGRDENRTQIHESINVRTEAGLHKISPRVLYVISFLSGFYVMTLENAMIRLTNLSFGSSSYSFAIIVSVFILMIATGSFFVSRLQRISSNLLCLTLIVITVSLLAVYASLDTWPYLAHLIRITCQSNILGMAVYYVLAFVWICLVLAIPVSFMGATLPIVFHEIKEHMAYIGRHSGTIFSFNTLGSLAGCLVGGIILYHFLDIREIFLIATCMASVSALLVARSLVRRLFYFTAALLPIVVIITFTAPWYNKANFKIGTFREREPLLSSFEGPDRFYEKFSGDKETKLYDDDTVATVSVLEFDNPPRGGRGPASRHMNLVVNGKSDSATYESTVRMLAHIPALLAEKKDKTLVIGMGTGITAGELTLYPEIHSIDVAEISPSVIKALPLFAKYNSKVHEDPRLRVLQGDAFNILKGTNKKYDIIISEPSNPWVTGVDFLFTKEFYALVKKRLSDDGLFVQWLQFYEASDLMLGIVTKTLSESFRYCRGYVVGDVPDLILVCSNEDISSDNIRSAEDILRQNMNVSGSLRKTGIQFMDQILVREIWSPAYISTNFSDYPVQTLDKPILHYVAGRDFFIGNLAHIEFIFNQKTANFTKDYLLAKKYPGWDNMGLYSDVNARLIHSLGQPEFLMPVIRHLSLRAYFNNPSSSNLPAGLANDPVLKVIPLITGSSLDQGAWMQVGLHFAPYRVKAEKLFEIVSRTRNWIVPYPLDGLKNFLMQGIRGSRDIYEKNWSVLQFCRILLEEQAAPNRINAVFNLAVKGHNGEIIVRPEDVALLQEIESKIQDGSAN